MSKPRRSEASEELCPLTFRLPNGGGTQDIDGTVSPTPTRESASAPVPGARDGQAADSAPDLGMLAGPLGGETPTRVASRDTVPVALLEGAFAVFPRHDLNPAVLERIGTSLSAGEAVRVPIVLWEAASGRASGTESTGSRFEIVSGEHRVAAARNAGVTEVPAIILHVTKEEALAAALREGTATGTDRSLLEEGWGLVRWIAQARFEGTQRELAHRLNRKESWVSEALRVARALPEEAVRDRAEEAGVSVGMLVDAPRHVLRRVARDTETKPMDVVDRVIVSLQTGQSTPEAWRTALEPPAGKGCDSASPGWKGVFMRWTRRPRELFARGTKAILRFIGARIRWLRARMPRAQATPREDPTGSARCSRS